MKKLKPKYRCDECSELHDDEDSAGECCAPSVTTVWTCPECEAEYNRARNADECCADEENKSPRVSPLELEAAGQCRLFP